MEEYRAAEAIERARLEIREKNVRIPEDFNLKMWKRINYRQPGYFEGLKQRPFVYGAAFAGAAVFAAVVFVILPGRFQNTAQTEVAVVEKSISVKTIENKNTGKAPAVVEMAKKQAIPAESVKLAAVEKKEEALEKADAKVKNAPTAEIAFSKAPSADAVAQAQFSSAAAVKPASSPGVVPDKGGEERGPNITIMKNVIRPLQGEKLVIKYKTSLAADVIAQVFDERGRLLKNLVRGPVPAGMHEISWDGKDEAGSIVGAGSYIVYIKTDLVEEKIKAAVIK